MAYNKNAPTGCADSNDLHIKSFASGIASGTISRKRGNRVLSSKYPLQCLFCKPKDCTLSKGVCMYPIYYRPVPEGYYNLNISETVKTVFEENILTGIACLVLIS